MKYMLLIYGEESAWTEAERTQCYADSAGYARELAKEGKYVAANPLHSVATATSLQIRAGRRLVTDGPFAETREQLGGYFLVNAANLDEAMQIAERLPAAQMGTVEIRPVIEVDGLPT